MNTVEKWGLFEVSLKGPSAGNPFTEQSVSATFRSKNEIVTVDGFYDGDGVYKSGEFVYCEKNLFHIAFWLYIAANAISVGCD